MPTYSTEDFEHIAAAIGVDLREVIRYCWDEDKAAQLHDDISSAMLRGAPEGAGRKNRQEYFLGPVIVTRERGVDGCNVIDGQQRLATLAIILAVLRDALAPESQLRAELQRMIVRPEHKLRHEDDEAINWKTI